MATTDMPAGGELDRQMSGTADGLIAFLDWAARTGELSANTAAAYKTAVTRVLEIDGEAWTDTSIREIDVSRQMDRFTRLRASRYNPTSLRTYGNRLSAAVTHYLKYLDDPATFRAAHPGTPRAKVSDKAKVARNTTPDRSGPASRPDITSTGASRAASGDLVQYPFPLRAGVMAYLSLPRDLSRTEAQRIAAFVASLAIDPAGSAEVHGQGDS
ncbi:MAG: hypothetical protein WBH47_13010 [Streptosporangiaceae bacterium]